MVLYLIAFAGGFAIAILFSYLNMLQGFKKYQEEAKEKLRFYAHNLKTAESRYEQMRAMSHNILTPLHGIRGSADNLAAGELGDEQMRVVRDISEKANEMFTCLRGVCRFHSNESTQDEITDFPSAKVLLVDDDTLNQKIATSYFQKVGIQPDVASSGLEAVQMVQKEAYDVVIMDLSMPEMDGIEATRHIRKLPHVNKSLVIIAFTANSSQECHEACLFSGMNDYLTKPATANEILHCMRKWLPGASVDAERKAATQEANVTMDSAISQLQKAMELQDYEKIQVFAQQLETMCAERDLPKMKEQANALYQKGLHKQLDGGLEIFFDLKSNLQFMTKLSKAA